MYRVFLGWLFALIGTLISLGCQPTPTDAGNGTEQVAQMPWDSLLQQARGQRVNMMMWQGDPLINAYMQDYVRPAVQEAYGIDLHLLSGQGAIIVQQLLAELEAGKSSSEIDLMWINGETFYQLRQIDALYGPWTQALPNADYIDFDNPFIGNDFQQPIAGYECPWGNVQMTIIYDSAQVSEPPRTRQDLLDFVRAHPGRFTFDMHFTGLTFLKALLIDIAGGGDALAGDFDEVKYEQYSQQLWAYLRELQPHLWRQGQTFPEAVAPMHQLFANGELWFTMSNNDSEVDNKISQGLFPATARAYVPDFGSIQNSHYLGISRLADQKAAAMVVANFMVSPAAQLRKLDPTVWGDGTVLDVDKLPDEWAAQFSDLPGRRYAPPRATINERALGELAPEYMIRLAEDFRRAILNQ